MASIVRWEPMDDFLNLRDTVNRLVEESFVRARPILDRLDATRPEMDIYETPEAIVIETVLPGVNSDDIEITMSGDVLTIKAEVKAEKEIDKECYLCRERHFGSVSRSVRLSSGVNPEKASAALENGILKLTIPKREESKPKIIHIKPGE